MLALCFLSGAGVAQLAAPHLLALPSYWKTEEPHACEMVELVHTSNHPHISETDVMEIYLDVVKDRGPAQSPQTTPVHDATSLVATGDGPGHPQPSTQRFKREGLPRRRS